MKTMEIALPIDTSQFHSFASLIHHPSPLCAQRKLWTLNQPDPSAEGSETKKSEND